MAKQQQKGLRDPFRKWSNASEALSSANAPLVASRDLLAQLNQQLNQPGLGRSARLALMKSINDVKGDIRRLEKEGKDSIKAMQDSQKIQLDILFKLSAIRSQVNKKDHTSEVLKALTENEKRLEKLLLASRNLNVDNMSDLLKQVHEAQKRLEELPDEIQETLAQQDTAMERIALAQEEARDFLKQQRDDIRKLKDNVKHSLQSFGWKIADRMGVGAVNVGNVIRGGRAIGRGVGAGINAAKYLAKTVQARRMLSSKDSDGADEKVSGGKGFIEKFSEYVSHTRLFQRRMMRAADAKDKSDSQSGGAFSLFGGLLGGLKTLLGAGGLLAAALGSMRALAGKAIGPALKTIASLGSKLAGPLTFLLKRAALPVAAAAAAWKAGQYIGGKIYDKIKDPLANTIDYFALPNHETGKTGFQEHVGKAKDAVVNTASNAWTGVKDTASSAVGSVKAVISDVGTAAQSGLDKATNAVATGIDKSKNWVGDKASAVGDAVSSGTAKVKDWVGKVFNVGGGVDVDGLNPGMQKNMVSMAQEYYEKTGKRLQLNSAYRSSKKQAELYARLPKGQAAPPGRSLHEFGFAFDTQSAQGNELAKMGLLGKYGFDRPIKNEPWHVQPKGMNVAAAKAGIYSADKPVSEGSATPVKQSLTPTEPTVPSVRTGSSGGAGNNQSSGVKPTNTGQPSSRVGVKDIPTYDMSDGLLLAMNIGLAA